MAGGGRCPRHRNRILRRRGGSKLGGRGGGSDDPVLTPSCHNRWGEWICVRGHRITLQGRMRVGANGDVYVPDSEEEDSSMEVEVGGADVADSGGAMAAVDGMQMAVVGVPPDSIAVGSDKDAANVVGEIGRAHV